jgi:hypothetical protein
MYDISPEELDLVVDYETLDSLYSVDDYLESYNDSNMFHDHELSPSRDDIYYLIDEEKTSQDVKHGPMDPSFGDRLAILTEEVGEVAKAGLNRDLNNLIEELIQVAASAVKWLECVNETSF